MVTSVLYQPATFGLVRAMPTSVGGVRSMLIPARVAADVLPAMSVAVPVADCPAPSCSTTGVGHPEGAMPLVPSAHVNPTATSVLFQPLTFAPGVASAVISGFPLSRRTVVVADVVFPAASLTDAAIVCSPSEATGVSAGHPAELSPESASLHVQWTVTGVRYQPAGFAATRRWVVESTTDGDSSGGVRSMSMPVMVVCAELPAASSAEPVTVWSAPSPAMVWAGGQD